jgi:hypothetical protein
MTYLPPKLQQISQPTMFCFSAILAVCFCLVLVATAARHNLHPNRLTVSSRTN